MGLIYCQIFRTNNQQNTPHGMQYLNIDSDAFVADLVKKTFLYQHLLPSVESKSQIFPDCVIQINAQLIDYD